MENEKEGDRLKLILTNILDDHISLWLNLEHLEEQTKEWRRFDVAAVDAAHVAQFGCFIDDQLA